MIGDNFDAHVTNNVLAMAAFLEAKVDMLGLTPHASR